MKIVRNGKLEEFSLFAKASGHPVGFIYPALYDELDGLQLRLDGSTHDRALYKSLWAFVEKHPSLLKTDTEWNQIASQDNGYCRFYSSGDGSTTFRLPKYPDSEILSGKTEYVVQAFGFPINGGAVDLVELKDILERIEAAGGGGSNTYVLPPATISSLGGVIVGDNISVDDTGKISISKQNIKDSLGYTPADSNDVEPYVLPKATSSVLGGVTIGPNITVNNGQINVERQDIIDALGYTPGNSEDGIVPATNTQLGGVKIGSGVNITDDGTISVDQYSLPTASSSTLGGVKIGSGISVSGDGTISAASSYTLPTATSSRLGGVKAGSNVTIAGDGTLSLDQQDIIGALGFTPADSATGGYTLPQATSSTLGGVKIGSNINVNKGTISIDKNSVTNALGYTPANESSAGMTEAELNEKYISIQKGVPQYNIGDTLYIAKGMGISIGSEAKNWDLGILTYSVSAYGDDILYLDGMIIGNKHCTFNPKEGSISTDSLTIGQASSGSYNFKSYATLQVPKVQLDSGIEIY